AASLSVVLRSRKFGIEGAALISGIVKTSLCVLGAFMVLPFGGGDGIRFERLAAEWSSYSFSRIISEIDVSRSYLISSITAVVYKVFGRDVFLPIAINGLLGIFTFYLSLILYREVWGSKYINKTFAW